MNAQTPYELYRVVTDYEALQDGFADRIEDLNTTLTEIDSAAGLTNGHMQRLINTNPEAWRPKGKRRQSRQFAWKTLAAALKGTGMALVLVVDDERFATIKGQLAKRRRSRMPTNVSIKPPAWLITRENAVKMRALGVSALTPRQRKMIAKRAAQARWRKEKRI